MKNQVQLITYADRLGGGNLNALDQLLRGPLEGLFGGVHLLPFYYPRNGADAGFDPIDHTLVDPDLGDWADIHNLSQGQDLVADLIVNHVSSASRQFKDYLENGEASPYSGMFLSMDRVFPDGARESELLKIYRPRPGLPFVKTTFKDGHKKLLWATFTNDQLDIDVENPQSQAYLLEVMQTLSKHGVGTVRLDAVGYVIKKAGSSCFMLPETIAFIGKMARQADDLGLDVLVEIHSYYRDQIEIARHVDYVYDYALPPLVLHAIFNQQASYLKQWLEIRPHNAMTVLDTHDGIGIIDVGADSTDPEGKPGLIPPAEIDALVNQIHSNSQGQSRAATGVAASNLDLYQINCTFYDALGRNDNQYLLARAIQLFVPGVPQIYYVGLFAGQNDMQLLAETGVGRDINRHYYSAAEIDQELQRPVVQALFELIRFRNQHPAFNGAFSLPTSGDTEIILRWDHGEHWALLAVDLAAGSYSLSSSPV